MPAKKRPNPHAWKDADYEAKGLSKLTLRLPIEFLDALQEFAAGRGLGRAAAIVEAVTEALERDRRNRP